jgi:hypothetical protein
LTSARRTALRLRLLVAMIVAALVLGLGGQAAWAAAGAGLKAGFQSRAEHSNSKKHHGKAKHHKSKKKKKKKKKQKKKKKKKKKTTTKPPSSLGAPPAPPAPATSTTTPVVSTPAPALAPTAPAPVVTPALVTHLLAQQGLLVGMASSVLQDQLYIDVDAGGSVGVCETLDGGGADELTSSTAAPGGVINLTLVLYYDTSCSKPYISSTATVTSSSTGTQITATSVYTDANATTLGTLTTQAQMIDGSDDIQLAGLGTFTAAAAGSVPVSLGLTCDVPLSGTDTVTLPCEGGVAQDFPGLGRELASLTPLTLTASSGGSGPALTFAGTGSTLEIASSGSVSLGLDSADALTLSGTPLATLTDSSSGQAGAFSLFPPTPTGWNTSDPADGQAFQISVTDDASRNLTGSVTASGASSETYATFSLDQSGSGTISYGGGAPVAVTSWVLTG